MLKRTFTFLFIFLFLASHFPASAQAYDMSVYSPYGQVEDLFHLTWGPNIGVHEEGTLDIQGNIFGGTTQNICEGTGNGADFSVDDDGPSGFGWYRSYAYRVTQIYYEIEGTGISGYIPYDVQYDGYSGWCGHFQGITFYYEASNINISSLSPNTAYNVYFAFYNDDTRGAYSVLTTYTGFITPGTVGGGDPDPVCEDPSANNQGQPLPCTYAPPAGDPPDNFSIYSTCFAWPNPEVEINFGPAGGATNYRLQKWHIYYYYDLYSGSYDYLDHRTDIVESGEEAWYRIVAENDYGSTLSNETYQYITKANCGGTSFATSVVGSGTVTAPGVNCPGDCEQDYPNGEWITITATPGSGYSFSSWTGSCAGQGASCSLYMDRDRTASAIFVANSYTLSVAKAGTGTGSLGSDPGGIGCGSTCSAAFTANAVVNLYATADSGSTFTGWSGACSGSVSPCAVTMSSARSVTATFAAAPFNYSLSNGGTSSVTKGSTDVYVQNTITKTLIAGATQSVSLSLSGVPSGVSYNISNPTCSPTCSSVITFTITPSATAGSHTITVTGSPLSKTTSFTLSITGAPISLTCSSNPVLNALIGQSVTWSASVSGGRAPLSYLWSGTNIPTSPAPTTSTYTLAYSTVGQKTAQLTITDADGVVSSCANGTIIVNFNPNFEEF